MCVHVSSVPTEARDDVRSPGAEVIIRGCKLTVSGAGNLCKSSPWFLLSPLCRPLPIILVTLAVYVIPQAVKTCLFYAHKV